jgi:Flp pilus assembly protein CpaB
MSHNTRRRWSRSSRSYLVASVILAVVAGSMLHHYLSGAAAAAGKVGPIVGVVVAREPVTRGSTLTAEALRVAPMPKAYAPPGSFSEPQQVLGRVALVDLATGEAVTETRLARVRAGPVASLVPEGFRAFAVPASLPPGTVAAGDRVDVLATYGSADPHAETVVEGAQVLLVLGPTTGAGVRLPGAAGLATGSARGTGQATLVLLVTPDQEERLAFARAFAVLEIAIQPAGSTA